MIVSATVAVYHHTIIAFRTKVISNLVVGLRLGYIYQTANPGIAFDWLWRFDLSV
jgi:hypothetical protein